MVEMSIVYKGQLRTEITHKPSKAVLETDAPVDNMGRGEAFSPTDLLAASLASCMLTTMAIVAQRENVGLGQVKVTVGKEMTSSGPRRVQRLTVRFDLPAGFEALQRRKLEMAAHACPVSKSLHSDVQVETTFNWAD
ncbi:MAG TPA: OsmC family protein [Tepidisphaeraceae bacterium]|jgi:putative redox protein